MEYKVTNKNYGDNIKQELIDVNLPELQGIRKKGTDVWFMLDKKLSTAQISQLSTVVDSHVPKVILDTSKEDYAALSTTTDKIDYMAKRMGLK